MKTFYDIHLFEYISKEDVVKERREGERQTERGRKIENPILYTREREGESERGRGERERERARISFLPIRSGGGKKY